MHSYDVLIVGGGPAGSSCAWGLRDSGLSVAILDKAVFPRDKVCGGWITPAVLKDLEIDPAVYRKEHVLQPITGFRVGCIGSAPVEINYGRAVSYGIRRREFDDYLLKRSGARLYQGIVLTTLERPRNGWIANGEIQAGIVIGAGGHFCPVARLTGTKTNSESAVVAQETEFEMDSRELAECRVSAEVPELYFCSDMLGYGWCFRKGNILNVGLGRADPHRLSTHMAEFLQFLKSTGRISLDVPSMHGHAYLLHGTSTRNAVGDGVMLIGDAAGLACPLSGEGIRPAIESGLLAARNIIAAHGLYSHQQLDGYRLQITAQPKAWLTKLGSSLPPRWISAAARRLLSTRWFVESVVLDRWFLSSEQLAGLRS